MIDLLKETYGPDIIIITLKITIEIFIYFLASALGSIIRYSFINNSQEKKNDRIVITTIIGTIIMFVSGNFLKQKIEDTRIIFGIAILLSIYVPNLKKPLKKGTILDIIIKPFMDKFHKDLHKILNIDDDKEKK